MEAAKKSKKGFAVPVSKPITDQDSKEKDKPKKRLGINRNNNKVEEKKASTLVTKKDKQKIGETKSSTDETKNEKAKTEKTTKTTTSEKKKDKPKKKETEEVKKVQRSLTADEYDEIFMNVLRSVMKAERDGDDCEEEEEQAPVATGEKEGEVSQEEEMSEEEEDAQSEVIEVTVKVESIEGSEHFQHVETEQDIDNWDGADKPQGNIEANVISPVRKENVKTVPSKQEKKSNVTEKQKQEKKTESSKSKEKTAAKSEVKPKKKKFVAPNEDNDKKVKKKKTESKVETKKPEKPVKSKDKVSLKRVMQERELEDLGTWVQCCNGDCLKWRYLRNITDPMDIPQRWECSMNEDEKFNSCEKLEEDYDEDQHIYTKYTEGSIVLAKMAGYPWWPGMIEIDPDYDSYFEVAVPASMYPTKYHVVFFDKHVSRAWISLSGIKPFNEIEALPRKAKGHDYSKDVNAAIKNAKEAMELPIKERLKKFSFAIRFSGKWGHLGEQNAKPKKHKKRGPKRQKFDEGDVMVDDKTLDQILNNSQSVLSDVAEMLTSIETATFDSDTDPEFDIEAPKQRKRTNPAVKVEKECPTLNAMAFEEEAGKDTEAPVKYEPGELDREIFTMEMDREIFTMEMDTVPMEASDLEKTVNELSQPEAINDKADAKENISDSEDAEDVKVHAKKDVKTKNGEDEGGKSRNNEDDTIEESSKWKKKSMKTASDDVDNSLEKENKVEKKKIKSNKENDKEDGKKKKKKSKKTGDNDMSGEKVENTVKTDETDKVETKKKKKKKIDDVSEKTVESTEKCDEKDDKVEKKKKKKSKKNLNNDNDTSEKKDKDVETSDEKEPDNVEKKKKKNSDDKKDVSEKKKKQKKNADDDTPEKKEVDVTKESEGKKKKMKSIKKSENEDKEESAKDSKRNCEKKEDDENETANTKEETESKPVKPKKPKAKFSNPLAKTNMKEDKASQGERCSQKGAQEEKDKTEESAKKPDSQRKSNSHIENNESDEELDFDIPAIPADGADSDDDFILDLMEPAQSKVQPAAQATVNDGDDSEPLDFEE